MSGLIGDIPKPHLMGAPLTWDGRAVTGAKSVVLNMVAGAVIGVASLSLALGGMAVDAANRVGLWGSAAVPGSEVLGMAVGGVQGPVWTASGGVNVDCVLPGKMTAQNLVLGQQALTGSAITPVLEAGGVITVTLSANLTFTAPTMANGESAVAQFTQPGAGGPYTVTWAGITFPGGVSPQLTQAANAVDTLYLRRIGGVTYGELSPQTSPLVAKGIICADANGLATSYAGFTYDGTNLLIPTVGANQVLYGNGSAQVVSSSAMTFNGGSLIMTGSGGTGGNIIMTYAFGSNGLYESAGGNAFRWTLSNDGSFRLQASTNGFTTLGSTPIYTTTAGRVCFGSTTDDTVNQVQVTGGLVVHGDITISGASLLMTGSSGLGGNVVMTYSFATNGLYESPTTNAFRWSLNNDGSFRLQTSTNGFTSLANTPFWTSTAGRVLFGSTTDDAVNQVQVTGGLISYGNFSANGAPLSGYYKFNVLSTGKAAADGSLFKLTSNDATNQFELLISRSIAGTGAYFGIQAVEESVGYRSIALSRSGGSVTIGNAALATTAVDGFLYIATCAGAPTGTPTNYGTLAALVFDTTNNKFWAYNGSAWKGVVLT